MKMEIFSEGENLLFQDISGLRPPTSSAVADYVGRRPKPEEALACIKPSINGEALLRQGFGGRRWPQLAPNEKTPTNGLISV